MSKSTPVRESVIESYLVKEVKKVGGLCYKFMSSVNGVPDRIVIYKGDTYFVEVKRPGGKVRKDQKKVHADIKDRGVDVYVIDTRDGVRSFIADTLKAEPLESLADTKQLSFDLSKI